MLPITPELRDHLAQNNEYRTIELFQFTLVGGTTVQVTNHDRPYQGYAPTVIERSMLKRKRGLEVQELEITWTPAPTDTILGYPITEAALLGAFDDAQMTATVVFMGADWTTEIGRLELFAGWVAQVKLHDWTLSLIVKNLAYKLAKQVPKGLYTAGCQWRVYDQNCGVNKVDYAATVTVVSQSGRTVVIGDIFGKPDGWYDLGVLSNSGYNYNIMRQVGTTFTLLEEPMVALNNQVVIYPGCNLTMDHCKNKFDNYSRYRGFPFIPEPEVAMFGASTISGPIAGAGK